MRLIFAAVLLVGLGLAGFAVYMAQDYVEAHQVALAQERAARGEIVQTVDVYVSARPLRYGEQLLPDDVSLVQWPEAAVPEGAYQSEEDLFPAGAQDPRTVLRAMEAGEALLAVKLTDPGEEAGVASRLTRGMRAFAISVDVASGVSGFLRPGDRVDVYWTGRPPRAEATGEVTRLIQSGVGIVAVDQSADEDASGPVVARTITVEATPQEVAALAQAQSTGRLSLALVGAMDDDVAEVVEVDQKRLLGIEERKIVEVEPEPSCTIRTRRGSEVADIPIPCTN